MRPSLCQTSRADLLESPHSRLFHNIPLCRNALPQGLNHFVDVNIAIWPGTASFNGGKEYVKGIEMTPKRSLKDVKMHCICINREFFPKYCVSLCPMKFFGQILLEKYLWDRKNLQGMTHMLHLGEVDGNEMRCQCGRCNTSKICKTTPQPINQYSPVGLEIDQRSTPINPRWRILRRNLIDKAGRKGAASFIGLG